jgi:hypothetical protein
MVGWVGWKGAYRIVASSFLPGYCEPAARALLPPGHTRCGSGGGLVGVDCRW